MHCPPNTYLLSWTYSNFLTTGYESTAIVYKDILSIYRMKIFEQKFKEFVVKP